MLVQETGKYKLIEDYKVRTMYSIYNFGKDTIINITQIDKKNKKVIGPEISDWVRWDMPVEKI